jgi:hypothetical protein
MADKTETEQEQETPRQRAQRDLMVRAERQDWHITEEEFRKFARTGEHAPPEPDKK